MLHPHFGGVLSPFHGSPSHLAPPLPLYFRSNRPYLEVRGRLWGWGGVQSPLFRGEGQAVGFGVQSPLFRGEGQAVGFGGGPIAPIWR